MDSLFGGDSVWTVGVVGQCGQLVCGGSVWTVGVVGTVWTVGVILHTFTEMK